MPGTAADAASQAARAEAMTLIDMGQPVVPDRGRPGISRLSLFHRRLTRAGQLGPRPKDARPGSRTSQNSGNTGRGLV
jgi:hypothetical protein